MRAAENLGRFIVLGERLFMASHTRPDGTMDM